MPGISREQTSTTPVAVHATAAAVGTSEQVARADHRHKMPTASAANPDTSGATLGELETEVNELKAALRTAGIIASS